MKKIFVIFMACVLLTACSEKKAFTKSTGETVNAVPYGLFTKEDKIEGVEYEINTGDVILSIVFSESLIVPAIIIGTDMYEPVDYHEK